MGIIDTEMTPGSAAETNAGSPQSPTAANSSLDEQLEVAEHLACMIDLDEEPAEEQGSTDEPPVSNPSEEIQEPRQRRGV